MKEWYVDFVSERLLTMIENDHVVWQLQGITIIPDWVIDKSNEIHEIYKAVNIKGLK